MTRLVIQDLPEEGLHSTHMAARYIDQNLFGGGRSLVTWVTPELPDTPPFCGKAGNKATEHLLKPNGFYFREVRL